jgi:hypothetical protein
VAGFTGAKVTQAGLPGAVVEMYDVLRLLVEHGADVNARRIELIKDAYPPRGNATSIARMEISS